MFEPLVKPTTYDPVMINPKGMKVMVPILRVPELLKKGFIMADPKFDWKKAILAASANTPHKGLVESITNQPIRKKEIELIAV